MQQSGGEKNQDSGFNASHSQRLLEQSGFAVEKKKKHVRCTLRNVDEHLNTCSGASSALDFWPSFVSTYHKNI